jgi:hypothetical protein
MRLVLHCERETPTVAALEPVLALVNAGAPAPRGSVGLLLRNAGFVRTPFDPVRVLSAARLLRQPVDVEVSGGLVLRPGDRRDLKIVVEAACRQTRSFGIGSVTALSKTTGLARDRSLQLLHLLDRIRWLGAEEWFTIRRERNPLERPLRKLLAIAGTVPLAALRRQLYRFPSASPPPTTALSGFCSALE